ncbi:hypothetical protein ABZY57_31845, partial [Streptomyces sp. NPDC006450]|uniref:hypothetical protein n=1 Tax=Streptomyces sp. NPDC006450 TaxID=3155458 RepID=UPI0033B01516
QRKRPFLENSTACQKSTPKVDTPSISVDEVPLKKTCEVAASVVMLAGNYTARTQWTVGLIPT